MSKADYEKTTATSRHSVWKELGFLCAKIIVVVGILLLVFTFVYGLHYNSDSGMNPAVKDGDLVMYYRWDKDYRAGDLTIVSFQEQLQIRRVVATAGDTVDITQDGLIINGSLQYEQDIYTQTNRYLEGIDFPLTLKNNEVFVLGDARNDISDSRIYGAVNIDDTKGSVITILRKRNL